MSNPTEREDVWYALSDLYLDTELNAADYAYIAGVVAKTTFSLDEIEFILFEEVHPTFCWNLTQVAGHWGDFGRDRSVELVTSYLDSPQPASWLQKLHAKVRERVVDSLKTLVLPDWQKLEIRIVEIREGRR